MLNEAKFKKKEIKNKIKTKISGGVQRKILRIEIKKKTQTTITKINLKLKLKLNNETIKVYKYLYDVSKKVIEIVNTTTNFIINKCILL